MYTRIVRFVLEIAFLESRIQDNSGLTYTYTESLAPLIIRLYPEFRASFIRIFLEVTLSFFDKI